MEKRRIYVAIPCPDEIRDVAVRLQEEMKAVSDVRLLDPGTMHLTVIPPWAEPNPDAVIRDLSAISTQPFRIRVTHAMFMPAEAPDRAHLVAEVSSDINRLWLQTWRAIMSHDTPRGVVPHVTFVRFPQGVALPQLPEISASGLVDRIAVYESLPGRTYRIIGERLLS